MCGSPDLFSMLIEERSGVSQANVSSLHPQRYLVVSLPLTHYERLWLKRLLSALKVSVSSSSVPLETPRPAAAFVASRRETTGSARGSFDERVAPAVTTNQRWALTVNAPQVPPPVRPPRPPERRLRVAPSGGGGAPVGWAAPQQADGQQGGGGGQ